MQHYPITHKYGSRDERYLVALEWAGYAEKRLILRFCGEFIDSFPAKALPQTTLRATGHRNALNGAPVFVNKPA